MSAESHRQNPMPTLILQAQAKLRQFVSGNGALHPGRHLRWMERSHHCA